MRYFSIIAVLLWASVTETVSSVTLSTIPGPSQGSPSTSALPEDCPSTVDLFDIVFISAVPIAAGFGLLLLLAFLQDLRQACKHKSKRSSPPSPCHIRGNRARKERTYVIDVDYAGRSRWGSFLRWCSLHKSPGANKNPHLVRLQGTIGFSDWLSFDLILGQKSEQRTLTTPRSIGKLVAVETKYPSMGDEFNSRLLPSSNIGACLRGIIDRACDNEIKNIHVMDTKTQDHYISGCGPSSAGISSSDQGITSILPLLLYTTQPASRVNYIAYYFKNGSLWTSAFTPWHQGNFTGSRRITCLFICISYTMVAVRLMSEPLLQPSLQEFVVVSPMGFDVTMGVVIKAAGVSAVLFPFLILIELLCRTAPTLLSSCGRPAALPVEQSKNLFEKTTDSSQLKKVQFASSHFSNSDGYTEHVKDKFPQKSVSAPDMLWQGTRPTDQSNQQQNTDMTTLCNNIANQCVISSIPSCIDIKPGLSINSDLATNMCKNIYGDSQSISAADQLECHHKLTCLDRCAVCHRTAGSKYYDPGAGCSQETASVTYNMYNPEGLYHLGSANSSSSLDSVCSSTCSLATKTSFSSSSISISSLDCEESISSTLTNVTPLTNNSWSTIDLSDSSTSSFSCTDMSELASITNSSVTSYQWPEDYNVQGSNNAVGSWDECCIAPSTPPLKKLSRQQPDSITRATSISGLLKKEHTTPYKQETHQHSPVTGSDYIVDFPIEFEMPEVTVEKSINHKSFFFRLRKWLKGFCSKSKMENDDKYKVKEAEMLAVMKTYLTHMPTVPSVDSETNVIAANNHCATRSTGIFCESIFLTPSQVIKNQLDTLSFSSSGSWSSITSAHEEAERKMIGLDHTNENNNNEVSTIEIRPCEEPTTRLPVSTNSDSAVAMDGIQSSSTLSTSDTDSLRNDIIISKDSANGKQDISQGNQSLSEIKPTASSKHCARSCFSILAAFVQIFLIISCIFATLWSVSSFHGVCWHTLWEWVTTSIIAIVIQAVILDTLKAVVVTVMKRHSDKRATTSLVIPHSLCQ